LKYGEKKRPHTVMVSSEKNEEKKRKSVELDVFIMAPEGKEENQPPFLCKPPIRTERESLEKKAGLIVAVVGAD